MEDNQRNKWLVPLQNRDRVMQVLVHSHYQYVVKLTAEKAGISGGCHNPTNEHITITKFSEG
jgi:hypothetical protein